MIRIVNCEDCEAGCWVKGVFVWLNCLSMPGYSFHAYMYVFMIFALWWSNLQCRNNRVLGCFRMGLATRSSPHNLLWMPGWSSQKAIMAYEDTKSPNCLRYQWDHRCSQQWYQWIYHWTSAQWQWHCPEWVMFVLMNLWSLKMSPFHPLEFLTMTEHPW